MSDSYQQDGSNEKAPCSGCAGIGTVPEATYKSDGSYARYETCRVCGGKGYI